MDGLSDYDVENENEVGDEYEESPEDDAVSHLCTGICPCQEVRKTYQMVDYQQHHAFIKELNFLFVWGGKGLLGQVEAHDHDLHEEKHHDLEGRVAYA